MVYAPEQSGDTILPRELNLFWGENYLVTDARADRGDRRVMQRLTAITVIIMVPNFVASIHGMNFGHLFPPSESTYGFIAVVAFLMAMVAWGFIHSRILGWL